MNIQRAMPDLIRRSIRHPVWLVAASALAVAAFGGTAKATFTPAGMTFTHSSGRHAARSIWIAAADGSGARQVASDGANASLSADGRWLAFNNGKVVLVDLVTGRRRSLGRSPDSECEIFWYCTNNLVWAPNGPRLAVNLRNGFSLIDAPSGRVTRLLGNRVGSFDFTPDGKRIVFSHDGTNSLFSGRSDIFALTLSNGRVRRLTNDGHSRSPVASRAGIAFVRDVEKYGQSSPEVWWMNWDGSSRRLLARCCANPKHLAGGAIGYETVDISNDGRHLLICQSSEMSCAPVALDLATDHMHQLAGGSALDLAADGNSVLVSFHPWDDEPGPDLIDSIPFGGGKPRLLVRQAVLGHWRG